MRYYLHVHDGRNGTALDDVGTEFPDLAAAQKEALASARELLSNAIRDGNGHAAEYIVVADTSEREVARIYLRDVLPDNFRQ